MKYGIIYIAIFLLFVKSGFSHDIENICMTDIIKVKDGFEVKIKLQTQGLKPIVFSSDPETSFNDYLRKPFDSTVLNPLTEYLVKNFFIEVQNGKQLTPSYFIVEWDEATKFSDHSSIVIKTKYKIESVSKVTDIDLNNSLLTKEVYSQKNIVNFHSNGKMQTFMFTRGNEFQKIEL